MISENVGDVETKLVTRRNPARSGLGGIVQTKNLSIEAIFAGVWGLGLSARLSGCRVREMDLEC